MKLNDRGELAHLHIPVSFSEDVRSRVIASPLLFHIRKPWIWPVLLSAKSEAPKVQLYCSGSGNRLEMVNLLINSSANPSSIIDSGFDLRSKLEKKMKGKKKKKNPFPWEQSPLLLQPISHYYYWESREGVISLGDPSGGRHILPHLVPTYSIKLAPAEFKFCSSFT